MRRIVPIVLLAAALACEKTPPPEPSSQLILITGTDMGVRFQNLTVFRGTAAVTSAQVTVNGTPIAHQSDGFYQGQLPNFLAPGETITIEVRDAGQTVTGTAIIPAIPVITAPVDGATITRANPLPFAWTSASNPDEFQFGLTYNVGAGGTGNSLFTPGGARSGTLQTSGIPAGATNVATFLHAYANGTFSGPVDPASKMRVRQAAATFPLILN